MKYSKIIIIVVLLMFVGRTMADNLLIKDVTMRVGGTEQVAVILQNSEKSYEAFQFDIVLPEGIIIPKDDNGKYSANLNTDRITDHELNVNKIAENTYRFMAFSMKDQAFTGKDGELLSITIVADKNLSLVEKEAIIKSQNFTDLNGDRSKWEDLPFKITIIDYISGDAYQDNEINYKDIVEIVKAMMNKQSNKYNEKAADVNNDGKVDIADIVMITQMILNNTK